MRQVITSAGLGEAGLGSVLIVRDNPSFLRSTLSLVKRNGRGSVVLA
jgi:hypothetical protein